MKYLFLFTTLIFAGELEVDGDLKVTGTVDANGNPITNVGAAISMTDAINGNVLQNALRDDGNYEYKFYLTRLQQDRDSQNIYYYEYQQGVAPQNNYDEWNSNFHNVLIPLLIDGWKIDRVIEKSNGYSSATWNKSLYILKRPISDD